MFFDDVKTEVYREGMTLEQFVKAATPDEATQCLKGKLPEMTLEGVTLDTDAFAQFRNNMMAVASRVTREKKAFLEAKKWLSQEYETEMQQVRTQRATEERRKAKAKTFWLEVLFTLLLVGAAAGFFYFAKVYVVEHPMSALRYISSGWLKAISIIAVLGSIFYTWYRAYDVDYKPLGKKLRLIASVASIASVVVLFMSLNTVAEGTYDISTPEELKAAGNFPVGSSFTLRGDVDMEGAKMKHLFRNFEGTFDGNGYTISNIEIKKSAKAGLFRNNSGTIQNLTVSGVTVNWKAKKNYSGSHYNFQVGVLVSYNDASGNVKDCTVKDSQFVIQGDKPTSAQATESRYASSNNCMGAVIGHNSYSGEYSGNNYENVTADFYMIRSSISGPYMPSIGYNSNK